MKMKILWYSSSGIVDIYAEVLNGPLKGKMIDVSIYARGWPRKEGASSLDPNFVEDLGKLSDEELKKKGCLRSNNPHG